MSNLILIFWFLCFALGCNAVSYKINIDDELEGALSGKFYHIPIIVNLMTLFYALAVFLILGIAISLLFKIEWYYVLFSYLLGNFIAFQIIPKVLFKLLGDNTIYFNGFFTLSAIIGGLIYYTVNYFI
jgi:hypothetical protein